MIINYLEGPLMPPTIVLQERSYKLTKKNGDFGIHRERNSVFAFWCEL